MRIFDMFKNKKLINLYDIKQKYWGFDLMFNTSCTEPKLYEEFNNIITDNNFDITTLSKYKKLNKNSNNEEFNEFYNEWIKALKEKNYVIHLDNNLNIDDFTIQVNNVLSKIGSTKFIDNNLVTKLYYDELQEYTINGKKIKEKINYDVLEANIVDKELKRIGYRLIYLFNGLDKYDKIIIPFSKFEKLNIIEKKIKKGSLNPKEGEKLIKDIENRFDVKLPQDYIDYMIENNGYVGIINEDYVDIWELESITLQNEDYNSEEFYRGLVLFGSDGGGEAYAFDKNNNMNIVDVPFIGDENDIVVVSKSFNEFLEKLRNYSDNELLRFTARGVIWNNIIPPKLEFVFYNDRLEIYKTEELVMSVGYEDIKKIKRAGKNIIVDYKSRRFNISEVSDEIYSKIKEIIGK